MEKETTSANDTGCPQSLSYKKRIIYTNIEIDVLIIFNKT